MILLGALTPLSDSRAAESAPTLLVFGDSLSASLGLDSDQGWVALLRDHLRGSGSPWQVVNASVSGETTSGGVARLPSLLQRHQPQMVILELGANDGLQGLPLDQLEANLLRLVDLAQQAGAEVLLVGMLIPPNLGPVYTERFAATFPHVAEARKLPLVPFLLEGVATDPALMQEDGLHPNAKAQPRILRNVMERLTLPDPPSADGAS